MQEKLFLKTFGDETNLRILCALDEIGEGTLYKICKQSGLYQDSEGIIRGALENLSALGLLEKRIDTSPLKGHRFCSAPPVRRVVQYRLNLAHDLMPAVGDLLQEFTRWQQRLLLLARSASALMTDSKRTRESDQEFSEEETE